MKQTKKLRHCPDLLTIKDLQEILLIGRSTAYSLVKSREMPFIMIRGQYRIPKKYLLDYMNAHTCKGGC